MRFGNNKLNRILAVALCAATLTGGFLPTVSVEAAVRSGQHSEVRQGRGDNQQHKRTDSGNSIINFRRPVRQNGKRQMKGGLKHAAKNFGYGIHSCGSPSLLISRNFDAIFSNDS